MAAMQGSTYCTEAEARTLSPQPCTMSAVLKLIQPNPSKEALLLGY